MAVANKDKLISFGFLKQAVENLKSIFYEQVGGHELRIIELEEAANPTRVIVSINPSGFQKKGTSTDVTISWVAKKNDGTSVDMDSSMVNGATQTSPVTYENVSETTIYNVFASVGSKTYSGSASIQFVSPIFLGFALAATATEALLSKLEEQPLRNSLGTITKNDFSNTSNSYYLWICSPYQVNKVTSDGFSADMAAVQTISVNDTTYYCYRSQAKQAAGKFNLVIS